MQYSQPYAPAPPAKPKPKPERIVIGIAIGFVLLLILAGAGYWYFMSGAEPVPAVGTAEVTGAKAAIYEGPSTSKVLQRLTQGDKVNVVRLPRSPRPEWVRVQYVNGKKVGEVGFARSSDLGNWSNLKLLSWFRPDESAGPGEVEEYVRALDRLAGQADPAEKDEILRQRDELRKAQKR
jgi:hypothetical protein